MDTNSNQNEKLQEVVNKLTQQLGPDALERVQAHLSSVSAHLMLKQDYPGDLKKTLFVNKALRDFFAYLESEVVAASQPAHKKEMAARF
jgi:hypothetical protein